MRAAEGEVDQPPGPGLSAGSEASRYSPGSVRVAPRANLMRLGLITNYESSKACHRRLSQNKATSCCYM